MDYSTFEVYNAADETTNFGARFLAEDNLYEACTLSTLSVPIDEDDSVSVDYSSDPTRIRSCIKNGHLIVAVNNRISVLADLFCSTLLYTEVFESIIDCFEVSDDAQLLFVCLRNGSVTVVDLEFGKYENREIVVENVDDSKSFFIGAFIEKSTTEALSFLVVNKTGIITRVIVNRSQTDEDSMKVISTETANVQSDVTLAVYSNKGKVLLLIGKQLISYNIDKDVTLKSDGLPIKSCHLYNHYKFIALLENGDVSVITDNLFVRHVLPDCKFEMLEYFATQNDENFMVTLSAKKESGKSMYELIKFPDYSSYFELSISGDVHLVAPRNINDEYLYICDDHNGCLRICKIYETNPMQRLQRLLRKGKYNEAEAIAAKFDLSKTEIYKARVQQMIDEEMLGESNMTVLLSFLNKIDDISLKLKACLTASEICEEFADVQRILEYGSDLEIPKTFRNADVEFQQEAVIEKLYLFLTYMELQKLTNADFYDMQNWINFIQINLIAEVQRQLVTHHFDEAILLYSRFEKREFELLTDKDIKKMLHSLSSVPLLQSRSFLCTFIPMTLRHKPAALTLIVSWARQRTQAMETSQVFPESAIDLIKTILSLLKINNGNNTSGQVVDDDCVDSPVELRLLLEMLESIKLLRDEFDVCLPLAIYMENNRSLIHSFLLVPMEAKNYKIFLQKFVIPFILKNNLNTDQVFLIEMKGLLAYEEKHWIEIVPAILSVFKSVTLKLETILLVLRSINPPWNDVIRNLAQATVKSAEIDHPLITQIKQCIIDEPIQIVLSKQEYCIPKSADLADALTFTKIIERIMYCMVENNSPRHENDIYTLCMTTEKRDKANLIFAETFINHGNIEKALMYVDDISIDAKIYSCHSLLSKAMNKISGGWFTDYCKSFWFEVFEPLMNRLELQMEPFIFKLRTSRFIKMRALWLIQTNFPNTNVNLNDICKAKSSENLSFITTFLAKQFIENSHSQQKLTDLLKISLKIVSAIMADDLDNSKTEVDFLLTICEETNDLAVIVAIAEYLHQHHEVSDVSSKTVGLIAVLLMRNLGVEQPSMNDTAHLSSTIALSQTMQNISFSALEEGSVGSDVGVNLRAIELAIVMAEMTLARRDDASVANASCNEVFMWVMCVSDLVGCRPRSPCRDEVPTMNTFNAIRQLTALYCSVAGHLKNANMELLSYYTEKSDIYSLDDTESSQPLKSLPTLIQHLSTSRHHFTALRIIHAFQNCLAYATTTLTTSSPTRAEFRKALTDLSKTVSAQVLKSVLTEDHIDTDMSFILLAQYDHDGTKAAQTISEYFRLYRKNYKKLSQLAELGLRLTDRYPTQIGLRTTCAAMKLRCKWIIALQPSMAAHEFFTTKADRLIVALITAGCFVTVQTIEAFCADFGLTPNDYFEVYVQRLVLSWKPERKSRAVVNGNKAEELYDQCMEVAKIYKGDLFPIINSLWGSINCYYYEVFLVVIRILDTLKPNCGTHKLNQKALLHFLQHYQRLAPPNASELEECFKRYPESHTAEPLSEWRLPFFINTFFSTNIWKILKPEINLNTYKMWFAAIPALGEYLTKEAICCYVIRSVVSSGALQVDNSHDWMLYSVRSDIFDEINECVTHVDNLEMATGALYHLTIHTPAGADQVMAAELCYTYAKKLRESASETADSDTKFEKVKAKYYGSRVNQILHTYALATDACLQLVSDANALIETIYMDPRILQSYDFTELHSSCPDINEAASEIAKLYEMDIIEKQKSLVEAWLFDNNTSTADDTIRVVFNNAIASDAQENFNDHFKRACYIFAGENINFWQDYLVEIGMNEEKNTKMESHLSKARALKCLYTISSVEKIESIVEVTYEELKNYVDKLFLLSGMERLGYNISIEELNRMNKIRLLQKLTRNLDRNITRIMASICTTYIISDLKCWEFIINNFIKFEQFKDLKESVFYLKDIQSFKYKRFYINAWQSVLEHDVSCLRYDIKAPVAASFADLILMIQACPISSKLNYSSIVEKLVQVGWWEYVAIFMQYLVFTSTEEKHKLIDEIKSHCPNIKKRLAEYSKEGILILKIERLLNFVE